MKLNHDLSMVIEDNSRVKLIDEDVQTDKSELLDYMNRNKDIKTKIVENKTDKIV